MSPERLQAAVHGVTREGAAAAARRELSKRVYAHGGHPSWLSRALARVVHWLGRLFSSRVGATSGHGVPGVLVLLLLILLLVVLLRRLGLPGRRPSREAGADLLGGGGTAEALRAAAAELAEQGDWASAQRTLLRAVVRELEDRAVIEPRAGRTATEVAHDAGGQRPELRHRLDTVALAFNLVWFGGVTARREDYASVVELDLAVRRAGGGAMSGGAMSGGAMSGGAVSGGAVSGDAVSGSADTRVPAVPR